MMDSANATAPNLHVLRRDLAAAFRAAVRFGMHEGVCNHFSLAVEANRTFLLNPHGVHFSRMRASNLALITFSRVNGNLDGQIAAFFVMVVAAAEVVVGLAIIMTIFRTRRSASVDDASLLRY